MRTIIRAKRSGQVLGFTLFLVGFGLLTIIILKAASTVHNSSDLLSSVWSHIMTEQVNITSTIRLKLLYLSVIGTTFLALGVVVLAFSRQVFHVSKGAVTLKCPYCNNHWKARRAMGWAECPHCRKFIQPRVEKTQM